MPENRKNLLIYASIIIPITGVLLFHAYLGSYTRFIADDYCSAYLGQRLGLMRYIWFWYLNWGGRFSAIAADMILAWSHPQGIGFVTASVLAVWAACLSAAIFKLLPVEQQRNRSLVSLTLGMVILFTLLLLTPNVPQSFYWYSAFRTHTLPLVFFSLYLAAYASFRSRRFNKSVTWIWIGGSFIFALWNAGFSEAFTVTQIPLLATLAAFEWKITEPGATRKNTKFLLAGLAGATFGLLIMLISPGNANRQEAFYQPSGILEIVSISIYGYLSFLKALFLAPEKIGGFTGAVLIFFAAGTQYHSPKKPLPSQIIGWFLTGLIFPYLSFLPAAYGIGDALPERAHTIPIFFLTTFMLSASFQAGTWQAGSKLTFSVAGIGATLILLSAVITMRQLTQSRHIFIEYAEHMDRVEQEIITARENGREVILIPKLGNWAGTFDPTDNPKFFSTACISMYYGIQVIGPNPYEP